MNNQNLLPLGSVVQISTAMNLIMIVGYERKNLVDEERYQYSGVNYPLGLTLYSDLVMFNEDVITRIHYEQSETEEEKTFREAIQTVISSIENP